MRITEEFLKKMIAKIMKTREVPLEAKEIIFADMVKRNLVPDGGTIEDADFWEVEKDHAGAVKVGGKYYYGEI